MTLAEYAEEWYKESGKIVPERNTPEWDKMYQEWIGFAFQDFES